MRVRGEIPPHIFEVWNGYEPVRLLPGDENSIRLKIEAVLDEINHTKKLVKEKTDDKSFVEINLLFDELESLANTIQTLIH